jgi:hypothetical protein
MRYLSAHGLPGGKSERLKIEKAVAGGEEGFALERPGSPGTLRIHMLLRHAEFVKGTWHIGDGWAEGHFAPPELRWLAVASVLQTYRP